MRGKRWRRRSRSPTPQPACAGAGNFHGWLTIVSVSPGSRDILSLSLGLLGGALLFFLCFAAIFTGVWLVGLFALGGFAALGALGVAKSSASPTAMAVALAFPALPWVLWLTPAAVAEAGVRGLLWPAMLVLVYLLAYLGGYLAARRRS